MALVEIVVRGEKLCVLMIKNSLEGVRELFSFDSSLAVGPSHAAKAVEVTLFALSRGEGLRNVKYEFYRRLLLTRELRKIPFPSPDKEICRVYLLECKEANLYEQFGEECTYDGGILLDEILRTLTRRPCERAFLEKTVLALVEATKQGSWLID